MMRRSATGLAMRLRLDMSSTARLQLRLTAQGWYLHKPLCGRAQDIAFPFQAALVRADQVMPNNSFKPNLLRYIKSVAKKPATLLPPLRKSA
jgi:hypothetical protein